MDEYGVCIICSLVSDPAVELALTGRSRPAPAGLLSHPVNCLLAPEQEFGDLEAGGMVAVAFH